MSDIKTKFPEKLMSELHLGLDRHERGMDRLNRKANSLLIISGLISGIIFGVSPQLSNTLSNKFPSDMIALGFILFTIFSTLVIMQAKNITQPISGKNYFDCKGKPHDKDIKNRCDMDEGNVNETITSYLKAMNDIENINKSHSKWLTAAHSTFALGILFLLISIIPTGS